MTEFAESYRMKRHKIQSRPKTRRPANTNLSPQPRDVPVIALPSQGPRFRWLVLATIVVVCAGAVLLLTLPNGGEADAAKAKTERTRWKPERWEPLSADDNIIDRFFTHRKAGDKAALEFLGPAPDFDEEPVTEETAAARQTDFFLRSPLEFRDIWRGEPDGRGGQRPSAHRYTLVTRGNVSSPPLNIRTDGGIRTRVQEHTSSPDLVVEVRDGKIYGLRAELHMGP
jgi:hypothetical protein